MIAFLKYIRGYLRIRVSGFSPERFMNLCSNRGILLWNIVREGDAYEMNIHLKAFMELRPIVRKTGTRVAVLQRYGFPFFVPRLLKRKVFVTGLVVAVVFWLWTSIYIWDIELNGNSSITEDVFRDFLANQKVSTGMMKKELDINTLEKEIRRQFPQITWASAKLTGTKLSIDIKENDAPIMNEKKEREPGSDLVAEYGGTVVSIIVRSGIPAVAAGETVESGAIMVRGEIPIYNDDATIREYYYVDADADIVLEHVIPVREELSFNYIRKEYTGRQKKSRYFRVGEKEWRTLEERPFLVYDSVIRESRPILFEKLSIPIYFGYCSHREYRNVEYEYTSEQAKEALNVKIYSFIESLEEKGVQIIQKDVKISTGAECWVISGEFLVHEKIGKSVDVKKTVIGDKEQK